MTSKINTSTINVNYPTPGVNNTSQGFRDNFAAIASNFTTASSEITDIQGKAIYKSALVNTTLNNDMANSIISNCQTLGFRASTFNLGNNLANTVVVDITNGDVQYGTITANAQIQFAKWAPTGTQSNVQLLLNVANANAVLTMPNNVTRGLDTITNYLGNGAQPGGPVGMPSLEDQIQYVFSTVDCGTNVTVSPINIPRQTEQAVKRIVNAQIGRQGDRAGHICIGAGFGLGPMTIVGGGVSYSSGATLFIPPPDVDGGVQAAATLTVVGGVVTGTLVTESGSGYLYEPTVTVVDTTGGVGAAIDSSLTDIPNYFYFCSNDYDGTTLIWQKLATQAW
jgi:hypothetical protein